MVLPAARALPPSSAEGGLRPSLKKGLLILLASSEIHVRNSCLAAAGSSPLAVRLLPGNFSLRQGSRYCAHGPEIDPASCILELRLLTWAAHRCTLYPAGGGRRRRRGPGARCRGSVSLLPLGGWRRRRRRRRSPRLPAPPGPAASELDAKFLTPPLPVAVWPSRLAAAVSSWSPGTPAAGVLLRPAVAGRPPSGRVAGWFGWVIKRPATRPSPPLLV